MGALEARKPVTTGLWFAPLTARAAAVGKVCDVLTWKVVAVVRATIVVPAAMETPVMSVPVRTMPGTKLASGDAAPTSPVVSVAVPEMAVLAATSCETLMRSTVPLLTAVMYVPAAMPVPDSVIPTTNPVVDVSVNETPPLTASVLPPVPVAVGAMDACVMTV